MPYNPDPFVRVSWYFPIEGFTAIGDVVPAFNDLIRDINVNLALLGATSSPTVTMKQLRL